MELGGKGANIVFADADLEAAVERGHLGLRLQHRPVLHVRQPAAGRARPCTTSVHRRPGRAAAHVPVGDPMADGTIVGPMAGPSAPDQGQDYVDRAARAEGAPARRGGEPPGPAGGSTSARPCSPTSTRPPRSSRRRSSGRWSPCSPSTPRTRPSRWPTAPPTGWPRASRPAASPARTGWPRRCNAGIVWVNGWSLLDPAMPFGGVGQSGYGRENGPEGLDAYLRTKSVLVSLAGASGPPTATPPRPA